MSGQCTGWVLRHGPTDRAMRAVLLTIADAANADGAHAYPGIDSMVRGSLYRRSHVLATLKKLVADGWVEVEEQGTGRGHATVYRVLMERVHSADPPDSERVQSTTAKGSNPDDERVQSTEAAPLYATGNNNEQPNAIVDAVDDDIVQLCTYLADRVETHAGTRPKITTRWHKDMLRLVERGALHIEAPTAVAPDKVRASIDVVFDHLNEPEGRNGFCWASQIRSPGALRDHWLQLGQAWRTKQLGRVNPGARAVARAAQRVADRRGLGETVDGAALGAASLFNGTLAKASDTPKELSNGSR